MTLNDRCSRTAFLHAEPHLRYGDAAVVAALQHSALQERAEGAESLSSQLVRQQW